MAWDIGDQIVVSPTGYFGSKGELWSDARGGVEVHTITQIVHLTKSRGTIITLASPLNQTHLCITVEGESFCGAVGVLTRSIRITSVQSEDPTTSSFGFGGHIAVIDLVKGVDGVSNSFSGFVTFKSVEFRNQGKLNSDHYAISFDYSAAHTPSIIMNCSFVHGYSMAVRAGNLFERSLYLGIIPYYYYFFLYKLQIGQQTWYSKAMLQSMCLRVGCTSLRPVPISPSHII